MIEASDEEVGEMRPLDIEKIFIVSVSKASLMTPENYQMAVNCVEQLLASDLDKWSFNSKKFEQLVIEKQNELRDTPFDDAWRRIELSSFKFGLLMRLWRDMRPKFLRGRIK